MSEYRRSIMVFHTALDVSLRSISICVVDGEGNICFEDKIVSIVDDIVSILSTSVPGSGRLVLRLVR